MQNQKGAGYEKIKMPKLPESRDYARAVMDVCRAPSQGAQKKSSQPSQVVASCLF